MKHISILFLLHIALVNYSQTRKVFFSSPSDTYIISSDLHIHTVFSDGEVWPSIRIKEARRDSLDLISMTEHLEYLPYKNDIIITDRNRSFNISKALLIKDELLMIVNGSEITKPMPPGHFNAIFVKDVNPLLNSNGEKSMIEANKQGAFVFWNHPNWVENRDDGIARLDKMHERLLEKKQHRPVTFILSKNRTIKSIRDALFNQKTFVWHRDMLIGKEENISPVVSENLKISSLGYYKKIVTIKIRNESVVPFKLKYLGDYTFHSYSSILEIPARGELLVTIKTKEILSSIDMSFEVLNVITAPNKNLIIKKNISL